MYEGKKWLSEEALHTVGERRETKSKWDRERYTQLNADFQRIAKTDKKAFLIEQYKEVEETREWEKPEISSRKLEISREGNISCKDGHDKGQKQ